MDLHHVAGVRDDGTGGGLRCVRHPEPFADARDARDVDLDDVNG